MNKIRKWRFENYLTMAEACKILKVSHATLWRLEKDDEDEPVSEKTQYFANFIIDNWEK